MRKRIKGFPIWVYATMMTLAWHMLSSEAWAAGGKPATKLVNVADTRNMPPGLSKWIAELYNTNLWVYGITVVLIMAGMGLVLGFGFDFLVSKIGIDLSKLEHHE